jgi:HEAT repeat protein
MNDYLLNLLRRMQDDTALPGQQNLEDPHESPKTVSSQAYEEARNFRDAALAPLLMQLIRIETNGDVRSQAYFILGWLAKNAQHLESKQFLVEALNNETETGMLVTILHCLADTYKPSKIDLTPIVALTEHNSRIRHAAYKALTNADEPSEDFLLLRLIEAPKDDVSTLITALMYVGTAKSLPALSKHLKSRNGWVHTFSRSAITMIMIREGFSSEVIQQKVGQSADWVTHHQGRLSLLTHPDRTA